ncbi:MAG: hypothetical protein ACO3A4_14625 [Silvanigrellaceae bacterium]
MDSKNYIERKGKKGRDFVYLDSEKKTISGCRDGNAFSAKFGGEIADEQELESKLEDFDNDGIPEFLLSNRFCGEGPCFGERILTKLGDDGFQTVYALNATLIEIEKSKNASAAGLIHYCFSYEMEIVAEYREYYEFIKGPVPRKIPLSVVRRQYPKLVPLFEAAEKTHVREKDKKQAKLKIAYEKLKRLIERAQLGRDVGELQSEYKKIAEPFGESGLPINCNVPEILQKLASEK